MSEIYQERLSANMGRPVRSLEEAICLAIDTESFNDEEIRRNLDELAEIAKSQGLKYEWGHILFKTVVKKEWSRGEDI